MTEATTATPMTAEEAAWLAAYAAEIPAAIRDAGSREAAIEAAQGYVVEQVEATEALYGGPCLESQEAGHYAAEEAEGWVDFLFGF